MSSILIFFFFTFLMATCVTQCLFVCSSTLIFLIHVFTCKLESTVWFLFCIHVHVLCFTDSVSSGFNMFLCTVYIQLLSERLSYKGVKA